ncbi:Peroxisomal membrane protein PEX29 [Candida viswanathii]|uniref:Peroxisomal membrane protein PEX29 n=1 Tax=Candida viswanathii TaxID=5486 RepID=A0A367YGV4_9ASCO|nr:Peroxisomal membrane protein PEX29 [Candida viswanathii]
MDQVSALLTNILTIEESPSHTTSAATPASTTNNASTAITLPLHLKRNSLEATTVTETETVTAMGEMSKKPQRRSMDLDFSSFWKSKEDLPLTNKPGSGQNWASLTSSSSVKSPGNAGVGNPGGAAAAAGVGVGTAATSSSSSSATSSAQYMADKLVEKVISVMVSNEIVDDQTNKVLQERMKMQKQRPSLSIALMQSNSNELHQRNSNMYIFIDYVEKFFSWQNPFYTIGTLLVVTHVVLNPYLLTVVPFIQLIATTFVPHYLTIYPPDGVFNSNYIDVNPVPSDKPLNTYTLPKPAPLFSREFFMNLTDTQNFMTMNIKLFDFGVWLTSDYLYFKNEQVTSVIYLGCLALIFGNLYFLPIVVPFLMKNFIIVQLSLIFSFWGLTIVLHPFIRGGILEWIYKEDTRLNFQHYANQVEDKLTRHLVRAPTMDQATFECCDDNDTKTVEIYELQKMNTKTKIWELVGFTPNFYTTNLVIRRYNNAILELERQHDEDHQQEDDVKLLNLNKRDTLTEVNPPANYKFLDSEKWKIDFNINAWVEGNLIQDLVIIDDDEKWAYDIITKNTSNDINDTDDHTINELSLDQIEKLASNNELYRRRRWIRKVVRMNYHDKKEQVATSTGISSWV